VQQGGLDVDDNANYDKQYYYDIDINQIVRIVDRTSWDLAFETTPNGTAILTNTSNGMLVSKTGTTDFSAVTNLNTLTLNYRWDDASGDYDSLAFRDWIVAGIPTQEVYVVDRGTTPSLNGRGTKKIKILAVDSASYTIQYANINGSDLNTKVIPKNQDKHYVAFRLMHQDK
jgi:hypothetical protein